MRLRILTGCHKLNLLLAGLVNFLLTALDPIARYRNGVVFSFWNLDSILLSWFKDLEQLLHTYYFVSKSCTKKNLKKIIDSIFLTEWWIVFFFVTRRLLCADYVAKYATFKKKKHFFNSLKQSSMCSRRSRLIGTR